MTKRRLGQIGTLVREKRGTRGVRGVAQEIGVSTATLSRVENGQQPDLNTFQKLCQWLEIDPAEFLDAGSTRLADSTSAAVATATAHLRAKREISPELARALGEMILRAQDMYPDDPATDDSQ